VGSWLKGTHGARGLEACGPSLSEGSLFLVKIPCLTHFIDGTRSEGCGHCRRKLLLFSTVCLRRLTNY